MNALLPNVNQPKTETHDALLAETPPPVGRLELTAVVAVDPHGQARTDTPALSWQKTTKVRTKPERFPPIGEPFLGFDLVEVLGTGAFAHVYLARQKALADRFVALKVTTRPNPEPQRLARLRHTNIVPIHSVHDSAPFQAVCMPYLGRCTLADVLEEYRAKGVFPQTTVHLISTAALARTTVVIPRSTPAPKAPTPVPLTPAPFDATRLPSQVELVLWILARLAEGLAHAHDRGILHLDIKPANVLLADDGQPLLLDFNLSYDVRSDDRPKTGGTLPYMSPEQLQEYRDGGSSGVDQRTDLFALGVIAFELLTGRKPFPTGPDKARNISEMIAVRKSGPYRVRTFNKTATPAVESIVLKLLHPDPERRYQSARDLVEDLERHHQNLPLKHAADRSIVERLAKWRRRNPKAPLFATLAIVAAAAGVSAFAAHRHAEARQQLAENHARIEALAQAELVRDKLAGLRLDLTSRDYPKRREAARAKGAELLASYGLPGRPDWAASVAPRLSEEARTQLGDDLGEIALLMAHSIWLDMRGKPTAEMADEALKWNQTAEECFAGRTAPVSVSRQRGRLLEAAGRPKGDATSKAGDTNIDLYLRGSELIAEGRIADAVGLLEKLASREPNHYGGQFAVAVCRQEAGDWQRALERYLVAQSLRSADPRASFNRGVILRHQGDSAKAVAAFTEAIDRDSRDALSYQFRASARIALRDYRGAIADLTTAQQCGASALQVCYTRATAYKAVGDNAAAEKDLATARAIPPVDALDYLFRGYSRLKQKEPALALADYEKAASLDPGSLSAWQNQASILADTFHDTNRALAAQEKAVAAFPEFAKARSGRAVLYARAGRRAEAHKDAEMALLQSPTDPWVSYQAACTYALTAATHPGDWAAAEDLFRKALNEGFRDLNHIETDADLNEARKRPAFREALAAMKVLGKTR